MARLVALTHAFAHALVVVLVFALAACERAPRPDPSRFDKVAAQEVPPGVEDPVVLESVKFDVGFQGALPTPPIDPPRRRAPIDPRPVAVEHGACGEPSKAQPDERPRVRAVANDRGKVTLHLTGFRAHCSPKPQFGAGLDPDGLVISELAPPEGTPIARCTCLHDVRIEVDEVPPGEHPVRVYSRLPGDGDPVAEATTSVVVPAG